MSKHRDPRPMATYTRTRAKHTHRVTVATFAEVNTCPRCRPAIYSLLHAKHRADKPKTWPAVQAPGLRGFTYPVAWFQ